MATVASMAELVAELQRLLGRSWISAVGWLRDANMLRDVQRATEAGDYAGALTGILDAGRRFASDYVRAHDVAASQAAAWLDAQTTRGVAIEYDRTNARAVSAMQRARMELVQLISEDARETLRRVIADGLARGINPRRIAREVRESIGLAPAQLEYVANFRAELEAGRWLTARRRELVDGNQARTLAALDRNAGGLTQAQVDGMVDRYRRNWIAYRADTISKYYGLQAAHQGYDSLFGQAVASGKVFADELVGRWNHAGRLRGNRPRTRNRGRISRTRWPRWRSFHVSMHGQERTSGDPFISGHGNALRFPLDPDAPASETVNCACLVATRYVPRTRAW